MSRFLVIAAVVAAAVGLLVPSAGGAAGASTSLRTATLAPSLTVAPDVAALGADSSLVALASGPVHIAPGPSPAGYLPLDLFAGTSVLPIGDEQVINLDVPEFEFDGARHTRIGVDSNGYIVVGGGVAEDNNCCNLTQIPDPARPNGVLAPFWTDLDGTSATGILANVLTDGVNDWIVVEWRVNVFATTSNRHFQVWIGINGVVDISYAYDPAALPADPFGQPFLVGAESLEGFSGEQLPAGVLPTEDLRVFSDEAPDDPVEEITDIKDQVTSFGLAKGVTTALNSKLDEALAALEADDIAGACASLQAFLNQVSAQKAKKKLTTDQAEDLTAAANEIRELIGC